MIPGSGIGRLRTAVGERDDVRVRVSQLLAEFLVLQSEQVDSADQGRNVCAELPEFLVLVGDRLLEPHDGRPQALDALATVTANLYFENRELKKKQAGRGHARVAVLPMAGPWKE